MNLRKNIALTSLILTAALLQACSGNEGTDAEAEAASTAPAVFIVSPVDGATVNSPVTVEFGIRGYTLAPAGTQDEDTGHHHLLIDTPVPALGAPIPADDNHRHFGKAQTFTELELEPGLHTLQLLLGDGNHVPHSTPLTSEQITITVVTEALE
jgi:hypothetical protein